MSILIPVANGSESLEAITVANVLRRAGLDVTLASVETETLVTLTREVRLIADAAFADVATKDFDAIIVPGGEIGAQRLGKHEGLIASLERQRVAHRWYGAICAAPAFTLSPNGLLDGKQATCYPSFKEHLLHFVDRPVVIDGHCITSQGPATAIEFALTWVEKLVSVQKRHEVARAMLLPE